MGAGDRKIDLDTFDFKGQLRDLCRQGVPRLQVMRERSRSRDDRDGPPQGEREPQGEHGEGGMELSESQATTGAAGEVAAGGEASGSAGEVAAGGEASGSASGTWYETENTARRATGMTSEERTRRNEEMAELTSQSNVAMFSRDSGMMADSVMMEDEEWSAQEWSLHSGREVEFDLQPGDEDPRIAIEALLARERPPEENERRRRQALERGRDQAVDEAIRRLGIPDPAQQDQTPDDPNVAAEVLMQMVQRISTKTVWGILTQKERKQQIRTKGKKNLLKRL